MLSSRKMTSDDKGWTASSELKSYQEKSSKVTNESVERTRDMLRLMNQCRDAGVATLNNLYEQGDQLQRTDQALTETSENLYKARTRIDNIEKASNCPSCCICCVSCVQKDPDRQERKQNDVLKNQPEKRQSKSISTVLPPRGMKSENGNQDGRYFPKILGTRAEDEIESNLDQVSTHVSELKGIAINMNTEVTRQNEQLDGLNNKTQNINSNLDDARTRTTDLVKGNQKSKKCCCCSIC